MRGKAVIFAVVAVVLVAGTAVAQGARAAVFASLGCALAGIVLALIAHSHRDRR
ncbi:hypothetical protein [Saccharothrix xinjiangensis]|uniref:MYXO-CTERM domain-containing protein n=1 Tax=Saccharothrix xinjiangensis TaxID=204798 RepID=A0ABV9Y1L7_9PSEU